MKRIEMISFLLVIVVFLFGKTVYAAPTIELDVTAPTFTAVTYGYTRPAAVAITITNNGSVNATVSDVQLFGAGADAFELAGSGNSWTIQPVFGLNAGTYGATITITYDGTSDTTATANVSFTVNKAATPEFTWPAAVTAITYGQRISDITLSFSSNDYGTFAWSMPNNMPNAGTPTATATFTPNSNHLVPGFPAFHSVSIVVNRADQPEFAFANPNPDARTYISNLTFDNAASGGGGNGGVTYAISDTSTGAASVSSTGQINNVARAGTIIVVATKAESSNHLSATATYTLTVQKAENNNVPTIPTPALASRTTTSITFVDMPGVEFSRIGNTWQTNPTFTGLAANQSFNIRVRYAATDTHNASADVIVPVRTLAGFINTAAINITAPAAGANPATSSTGTGDFSHGTISWSPAHNPFQANTVYTATVTLTGNDNYEFEEIISATINTLTATISDNTGE
ncbi:MAG: hypothetical protein LBI27_06570, partial [Clostridiales bacterium]|nr:hypothetical protein [Clostridiales bacterium]